MCITETTQKLFEVSEILREFDKLQDFARVYTKSVSLLVLKALDNKVLNRQLQDKAKSYLPLAEDMIQLYKYLYSYMYK